MEGLKQEIVDLIKLNVAREMQGVHGRLTPVQPGTMAIPGGSGAQAKRLTGEELAKIGPIIDEIDNEVLRNQVRSYFSMTSKYQALGIITNERSEVCKRYPKLAIRIAEVATEIERVALEAAKRAFH